MKSLTDQGPVYVVTIRGEFGDDEWLWEGVDAAEETSQFTRTIIQEVCKEGRFTLRATQTIHMEQRTNSDEYNCPEPTLCIANGALQSARGGKKGTSEKIGFVQGVRR